MVRQIRAHDDITCFNDLDIGAVVEFEGQNFVFAGKEGFIEGSTACGCAQVTMAPVLLQRPEGSSIIRSQIISVYGSSIDGRKIETLHSTDPRYSKYQSILEASSPE